MEEQRPILTVDVVLFTVHDGRLCAALQRRDKPPFEGRLALVGGYVHPQEDASTLATAQRVLREKAGLTGVFLEQLMTFSGPDRDPRGWSASVAYYALAAETTLTGAPVRDICLSPVEEAAGLPFDHDAIVARAVERLRSKGAYSSLPVFLLPRLFTMSQLRDMYSKVMGTPLNDSAFRRKIEELQIIEPAPGQYSKASARPAQLYRLKNSALKEFRKKI
jgi:8-oxo-dGTP diphosphatase